MTAHLASAPERRLEIPSPSYPVEKRQLLWLACYFPSLALEVLETAKEKPVVITEQQKHRTVIHTASEKAAETGIHAGMALATAQALCPELQSLPRRPDLEAIALEDLAAMTLDFTSWVSLSPPQSLLLEVGGSEHLFNGLDTLQQRLLRVLPYAIRMAVTPAPSASLLLARAGLTDTVRTKAALRSALGEITLQALELPDKTLKQLNNTGLQYVRDLWRLPRADLIRRFGKPLGQYLDRLSGLQPEPQTTFQTPPVFKVIRELSMEADSKALFWPTIHSMLEAMVDFLVKHDAAVRRFMLRLLHRNRRGSEIILELRQASRDSSLIAHLLEEKLDRQALPAPVIALALETQVIEPFLATTPDLFGNRLEADHEWQRLLEQLQNRLGRNAVQHLVSYADHRPEKAGQLQTIPLQAQHRTPNRRPLWLLRTPHRLPRRPSLLSNQERIQSGWWDGCDIQRDYFVARTSRGDQLWVYRNREQQWYVHGVFG